MGIEPTSEAWEASILPLYDARLFLALGPLYLRSDTLVQLQKKAALPAVLFLDQSDSLFARKALNCPLRLQCGLPN
jgi:hypothetical protein